MKFIDWLNNNSGVSEIVAALVGATASAFFAVLGWIGGRIAGKKAAQKEVAALRIEVKQQAEKIANIQMSVSDEGVGIKELKL